MFLMDKTLCIPISILALQTPGHPWEDFLRRVGSWIFSANPLAPSRLRAQGAICVSLLLWMLDAYGQKAEASCQFPAVWAFPFLPPSSSSHPAPHWDSSPNLGPATFSPEISSL